LGQGKKKKKQKKSQEWFDLYDKSARANPDWASMDKEVRDRYVDDVYGLRESIEHMPHEECSNSCCSIAKDYYTSAGDKCFFCPLCLTDLYTPQSAVVMTDHQRALISRCVLKIEIGGVVCMGTAVFKGDKRFLITVGAKHFQATINKGDEVDIKITKGDKTTSHKVTVVVPGGDSMTPQDGMVLSWPTKFTCKTIALGEYESDKVVYAMADSASFVVQGVVKDGMLHYSMESRAGDSGSPLVQQLHLDVWKVVGWHSAALKGKDQRKGVLVNPLQHFQ
jgi:hypothetical protein